MAYADQDQILDFYIWLRLAEAKGDVEMPSYFMFYGTSTNFDVVVGD